MEQLQWLRLCRINGHEIWLAKYTLFRSVPTDALKVSSAWIAVFGLLAVVASCVAMLVFDDSQTAIELAGVATLARVYAKARTRLQEYRETRLVRLVIEAVADLTRDGRPILVSVDHVPDAPERMFDASTAVRV